MTNPATYESFQAKIVALPSYKDGKMTRRRRAIVNAIPAGSRVLSVACGAGTDLKALEAKGCTTRGIDIAPAAVKIAQAKGLDVILGDADKFQTDQRIREFMLAEYDAVIFSKCLGYLKRKNELMKSLRTKMIVINQRNPGYWKARLAKWRGVERTPPLEDLPYMSADSRLIKQESLRDLREWGESYGFRSRVVLGNFFRSRDAVTVFYRLDVQS
jgi:methionine biosynthesis protein MetW